MHTILKVPQRDGDHKATSGSFLVSLSVCHYKREFAQLVDSLQDDDSIDMKEVLNSEEIYIRALSNKEDFLYSEVDLLVGEEEEMVDREDDEEEEDNSNPDMSDYPEELDLRNLELHTRLCIKEAPVVHVALFLVLKLLRPELRPGGGDSLH